MQLADALLDAAQAEAARPLRRIEPDTVVGDRHSEAVGLTADGHRDVRRARVADAVGERFLHGAVDAGAVLFRQEIEVAVDGELDRHAKAPAEVAHVPFERGLEAEVVEHARPQAEREIADRADHVVYELPALGDGTGDAVGPGPTSREAPGEPSTKPQGSVGARRSDDRRR